MVIAIGIIALMMMMMMMMMMVVVVLVEVVVERVYRRHGDGGPTSMSAVSVGRVTVSTNVNRLHFGAALNHHHH